MAARIKKGDKVVVITGAQKGVEGEVMQVFPDRGAGTRPRHSCGQAPHQAARHGPARWDCGEGELRSIVSNLKLIDPKSGKPTKVGFRVLDNGTKARVAKATGELIEG